MSWNKNKMKNIHTETHLTTKELRLHVHDRTDDVHHSTLPRSLLDTNNRIPIQCFQTPQKM